MIIISLEDARLLIRGHRLDAAASPQLLKQLNEADLKPMCDLGVEPVRFESARVCSSTQRLVVSWAADKHDTQDLYPLTWLRDACPSPSSWNPSTKSRRRLFGDLRGAQVKADGVSVAPGGKTVSVRWADGHVSTYDGEFLYSRSFRPCAVKKRLSDTYMPERIHWGSEMQSAIPSATYTEVLTDNGKWASFIKEVLQKGLFIIRDAPLRRGIGKELLNERKLMWRDSHYGEFFEVNVKENPVNLMNTTDRLELHTDYPYYDYSPGVQWLHCIKQSEIGGESELSDGFNAAEQLRKRDPAAFDTLCRVPFDYNDIGVEEGCGGFYLATRRPVLKLDAAGQVDEINYNNMTRSNYLNVSLEEAEKLYAAMQAYYDLLYDPANFIRFRLKQGDIMIFNNLRVLHGRGAYNYPKQGLHESRFLEGWYTEWSDMLSSYRVHRQLQLFSEKKSSPPAR